MPINFGKSGIINYSAKIDFMSNKKTKCPLKYLQICSGFLVIKLGFLAINRNNAM